MGRGNLGSLWSNLLPKAALGSDEVAQGFLQPGLEHLQAWRWHEQSMLGYPKNFFPLFFGLFFFFFILLHVLCLSAPLFLTVCVFWHALQTRNVLSSSCRWAHRGGCLSCATPCSSAANRRVKNQASVVTCFGCKSV